LLYQRLEPRSCGSRSHCNCIFAYLVQHLLHEATLFGADTNGRLVLAWCSDLKLKDQRSQTAQNTSTSPTPSQRSSNPSSPSLHAGSSTQWFQTADARVLEEAVSHESAMKQRYLEDVEDDVSQRRAGESPKRRDPSKEGGLAADARDPAVGGVFARVGSANRRVVQREPAPAAGVGGSSRGVAGSSRASKEEAFPR